MESTMSEKRVSGKTKNISSKARRNKRFDRTKLTLDDIEVIGGNESDLKLIGDISESDGEDIEQGHEDGLDVDPQELKAFIDGLGFKNVPTDVGTDLDIEDNGSSPESTPPATTETEQTEAKKKLNKKEKKAQKDKMLESNASPGGSRTTHEPPKIDTAPASQNKGKKKAQRGLGTDLQHSEVSSTSEIRAQVTKKTVTLANLLSSFIQRRMLLFEPEGLCFYREFQSDPNKFELADDGTVTAYKGLADRLYTNEVQIYTARKQGDVSSRAQWMQTVVSSGVLADKIAALTLQVQTAPLHSAAAFDTLMTMVKKKGRRETLVAMDAMKQLCLQEMLPERRKLRKFSQHPFCLLDKLTKGQTDERDRRLILWYFEDQLKQKYQEFITTLEKLSHDTIPAVKQKSISTSHELLKSKPEQEKALLTLLINKVGDPDYKIAARAVHLLQKLVEAHTNMKGVIVTEVESLLYRANVSPKAQYYAVCFLNQLILHHDDPDLATKLIVVYFSFFKACMKKKDVDPKMMGAVLTGVNRAYPYSNVGDERIEEQTDALFKVVHIAPFNTAIQALLLLKQVLDSRQTISDRFYSALYSKVLDRNVEHSPRQAMFLNLIYQSLKADNIIGRTKAFVKRLLQTCSTQQPPFICGCLFLISEVMDAKPALLNVAMEPMDSDDEEHFVDIDEDVEDATRSKDKKRTDTKKESSPTTSSWVHHKNRKTGKKTDYDPINRNPQYCGAEGSLFWELSKLQSHYHPTVALFAEKLRQGLNVHYMGNPLQDFTLMRFLDRFVYRNPKKQTEKVKLSIMEPKGKSYKPSAIRQMPVNTKRYLQTATDKIPIDERFFHKYFTSKTKKLQSVQDQKRVPSRKDDIDSDDDYEFDSDASSINDDDFDRIIENMKMSDEEDDDEDDDDDLDFAGEVSRKKKDKKKKTKKKASEEDSSDEEEDFLDPDLDDYDDDDDDDDSEEDYSIGDEDGDEFKIGNDDFDEEGFGESDDDDDDFTEEKTKRAKSVKSKKTKKPKSNKAETYESSDSEQETDFLGGVGAGKRKGGKMSKKGGKKRRKGDGDAEAGGSLQANAEEFSSLMDEHVGAKFDSIGLNAMANKDNADAKQLNWELKRNQWIQGRDPASMMTKKHGKFNRGKASKKRPNVKKGGKAKRK